jgi:CDP-4-dehydro-6-deoxyglucose reductase
MNKYTCSIESIIDLNPTTQKLLLNLPDGQTVRFKAGQYLDIILPSGKKCPFSIASPPAVNNQLELHIRPTPGSDDSEQIDELLKTSSVIVVEAPKGDCYLESAPDSSLILMAASTGITQMKCILEHLFAQQLSHPVYLYWGVLVAGDLYLDEICQNWMSGISMFDYVPVVSEPENSLDWTGRTGLVAGAVLQDFPDLTEQTVYVSGGPGMVYATLDLFLGRGLAKENIHSDIFSIAPRPGNLQANL